MTYDSEHARITQALTTASTTTTTNYLNDAVSGTMSEKVTSGSATTWNDYLMVDGRLVGERVTNASGTSWQYFILDHLGSVAVVTDDTPGSSTFGKVLTTGGRLSFDAWGKQRFQTGNDDPTCSQGLTSPTTRGFTSQEDIAALCLVNLNARLYDPSLGRFLSADSFVADPTDAQAYNRYTYVSNRPLSFTDPTGHEEDGPECIGSCGNTYNPGSQSEGTNSMAHPEMEVLGSFAISESGNLDEGVNAIHITYNVSGESIASQDPTKGEVSTSAHTHEVQSQSDCDPKSVAQTGAAQNAAVSSVTSGTDDTQNGNGSAKGLKVSVQEFSLSPIELSQQQVLPGAVPAYFYVNPSSPNGGMFVQDVQAIITDANGNLVTNLVDSEYSEAWRVNPGSTETQMHEQQKPRDDLFGALVKFPRGDSGVFRTTVRFYDGLDEKGIAKYGFTPGGAVEAGPLLSKVGPPGIPTNNASAVVPREWHFTIP